ncbi:calcium-binding protein [Teichococcus deserti]|nr:calcium-binding protein [Pseudoroseomonas deserti]
MSTKPISSEKLEKVVGGAFVQGTAGADNIVTGNENDVVLAGAGNDHVATGVGHDQVQGQDGNDVIDTGAGNDLAFGGAGHDYINGGQGSDQLYGEDGNDILDGGAGDGAADLAFGGAGDDTFIWAPGDGNDQFEGGPGNDTLRVVGMSMHDLQSALNQEGRSDLTIRVQGNGITFVDAHGQPATFNGSINVGGETMRFSNIEKITLG